MTRVAGHPVVLYDGSCGFCAGWVQWVLARDRAGRFRFAALDSAAGQQLLRGHGLHGADQRSVVLIGSDGRAFTGSTAALRIPAALGWPWQAMAVLLLVPRPVRDAAYRWVADRRHELAPRACVLPTPEERPRFLDREGVRVS